jgi:outer membrane lipoprotein SlyB
MTRLTNKISLFERNSHSESAVGCAEFGETVREHPRAATGTAVGAAGGAVAGGLISTGAAGAVVGGLVGGLAGGLIGNAMDAKRQDVASAASTYNYDPAQGTVVRIQDAAVEPPRARPGGQVYLVTHYALLTPHPDEEVTVIERWHITRAGQVMGTPVRTVRRQGGEWVSTLPMTLPTAASIAWP